MHGVGCHAQSHSADRMHRRSQHGSLFRDILIIIAMTPPMFVELGRHEALSGMDVRIPKGLGCKHEVVDSALLVLSSLV